MTKKTFPSDKLDQYIVRFPDGMRDRIKDEAAKNGRSMNAEIVARLEDSFDTEEVLPLASGALDSLEDSIRQNREMLEASKGIVQELKGLRAIIRYMAENDEQPDPELKSLLKAMVAGSPAPDED